MVFGLQCRQNRTLRGADAMAPDFRVIKLRHHPRHPTQVEAHAVFACRHIQILRHRIVYMHYLSNIVNCHFGFIFGRGRNGLTVKYPLECQALYETDGVQHVQGGVKYPAVMGVAGWNDHRVPPWQPGKFVAALQSASASPNPVLMMVNYDSGHFTKEKAVEFRPFANQMAFLLWQTGHKDFQQEK